MTTLLAVFSFWGFWLLVFSVSLIRFFLLYNLLSVMQLTCYLFGFDQFTLADCSSNFNFELMTGSFELLGFGFGTCLRVSSY